MLGVLACPRAWLVCVLGVLTCLACLRIYVLPRLVSLRACMLVLVMMKCLIFLRVCVLGVYIYTWCAFLSHFLYISILKFKNSCSEKFVCLVDLNMFLIHNKTIKLIKLFETNLREAGKSINISCSCSCSKAVSIFYKLYIHLLH